MTRSLGAALLLLCSAVPAPAEEPVLDVDLRAASPVNLIDLATVSRDRRQARVSIVPDLLDCDGGLTRQREVDTVFIPYLDQLDAALTVGRGRLVHVILETDEAGACRVPLDFMMPIGDGTDPVDAYAEYLNRPPVPPPPAVFLPNDAGYLLWIEKKGPGEFAMRPIPRSLVTVLLRQAAIAAREKTRLMMQP